MQLGVSEMDASAPANCLAQAVRAGSRRRFHEGDRAVAMGSCAPEATRSEPTARSLTLLGRSCGSQHVGLGYNTTGRPAFAGTGQAPRMRCKAIWLRLKRGGARHSR